MRFPTPLVPGRLIRREKRFLAHVALTDGETVIAHVPNTGSMLGLADPGLTVWLSRSNSPGRKLAFTLELVQVGQHLVGVNTARPNTIVAEAILAGLIPDLQGYARLAHEVRYGERSRVDLLLDGPERCYVEVKNVTLKDGSTARFPDARSERARRHLAELSGMVAAGHRAVVFFLVNRADCESCGPAHEIDPVFAEDLVTARARGVEILAYATRPTTADIVIARRLPFVG